MPTFLPTCLHTCPPACLLIYLPACLPTYLPSCLHSCLPANLHKYLPASAYVQIWLLIFFSRWIAGGLSLLRIYPCQPNLSWSRGWARQQAGNNWISTHWLKFFLSFGIFCKLLLALFFLIFFWANYLLCIFFSCVSSSITLNFTHYLMSWLPHRHLTLFSLLQSCMDLRDFGIKGLRDLGANGFRDLGT